MPYLIALVGVAVVVVIWLQRARMAADAARELTGVAQDVMSAARRFGFRRRYNQHPVESLEDPDVAIAGAGIAFLELGGLPTAQQQDRLIASLQSHLNLDRDKAEEAAILGRWLVTECGGAGPGIERLAKRIYKLSGHQKFEPLMMVLKDVAGAAQTTALSPRQSEALAEVATLFKIR